MTHLINSRHIEKFEKSVHKLIDDEMVEISEQLDKQNNDNNECVLWRRYDQLRFIRALLDGKFKYDSNQKIKDNEIIEITE